MLKLISHENGNQSHPDDENKPEFNYNMGKFGPHFLGHKANNKNVERRTSNTTGTPNAD
jgi:hypothetical protein